MINCTVRQSVLPSASSAAISGSRASNASAWATKWLAPIGDVFIAADTSAVVRANPVIIAYPGSGSASSASAIRCDNSAAIAASRWAISADSCCWLASISVIKASGVASSNILSIIDRSTDKKRVIHKWYLGQFHQDRGVVARGLAFALL